MPRESIFPRDGILHFSQILEKAVVHSGLNQLAFSKKAGVGQSSISNWVSNLNKLESDAGLSTPSAANIMTLSKNILNPQTDQAFTPSELFAICSGENRLSASQLDKVKLISDSQLQESKPSDELLQTYWDHLIVPNVSKMLDAFGEPQPDGIISFESRDYDYSRDASGEITISPKDGRGPLQPDNMTQKDIKVMTAIADKVRDIKPDQAASAKELSPQRRARAPKM